MIENKVLIVDDEIELGLILRDFLEHEGMKVEIAINGEEAYDKYASFLPNLVILDIMLPDDDGMEICRKIRSESDIPIVMLSAKDTDIDKILSLGLGADEYLTKPYSPTVVVAHVKALLRRYRLTKAPIDMTKKDQYIEYDGFILDAKKHSVTIEGNPVILVGKEFELLKFMALKPGEVFSKERLYDEIWGVEEFGEISTVTVHIRKIREKVELDPANPKHIKTIWGVGYKFEK